MAAPTNTHATEDTVGIREDLSDMIKMVEQEKCPFTTMAGSGKASNTKHEWLTEALAAANGANAHAEGDDTTADASIPAVRLDNRTQIFKKSPTVSGTNQAVNTAGATSEMARQIWKRTKEIKRDIETACLLNQAKVAGTKTTAGRLAGVPAWVETATSAGSGGADPTGDGSDTRTDGTQRAFTESLLLGVLQANWSEGGEPDCIMVGAANKQTFANFTGRSTVNADESAKGIINSVDWYVSPFSSKKLAVVANQFQRARDCHIIQKDMWSIDYLRPLKNTELSKTGDSEKRQMITELTLAAKNEKSGGGVFDLTT